jgi:hypothetical protein
VGLRPLVCFANYSVLHNSFQTSIYAPVAQKTNRDKARFSKKIAASDGQTHLGKAKTRNSCLQTPRAKALHLHQRNPRLGAAALPVGFRQDSDTFNHGLKKLPSVAATLRRSSIWRVSAWVLPSSNHLTYGKISTGHTDYSGTAIPRCVAGQAHRSGLRRHGCRHEKNLQPDVSINISTGEPDLPSAPVLSRIDI